MNANRSSGADSIAPEDFETFAHYLEEACGIALAPNKQYLVSTRVRKILSDHHIDSIGALVRKLTETRQSSLKQDVIDAMTTNETYWFRDAYPFEYLKDSILPELMSQPGGDIKLWSAACSSGQEPYSLSMEVEEFKHRNPGLAKRQVRILATDVSSGMLNYARSGTYDRLSMARGMTNARTERFFEVMDENNWRLKANIRSRVEFKSLNLLESYSYLGKFDVIFCRNVLIYFSNELKREIITKMHGALKPNGILCLGSSEGLSGVANLFEMIQCKPGIMYRAK
ncbi:CheR family methyltransferase [Aurantivibrio plasticivorans]